MPGSGTQSVKALTHTPFFSTKLETVLAENIRISTTYYHGMVVAYFYNSATAADVKCMFCYRLEMDSCGTRKRHISSYAVYRIALTIS
jgi:hypothetical protein